MNNILFNDSNQNFGDKHICPYCNEEKVKFYDMGKAGDPTCPKCGKSHNRLEYLRLKSYYQQPTEEEVVDGATDDVVLDDAVVLEDPSELVEGDEPIVPEVVEEKTDGE